MNILKRPSAISLLYVIIIFELSAFVLIGFMSTEFDYMALAVGIAMVLLLLFQYITLTHFFENLDRYILITANVLAAIGMIMQYRMKPDLAYKQLMWLAVGMVLMVVAIVFFTKFKNWKKFLYPLIILAAGLLVSSLLFGKTINGSKNWFSIAGVSLQPSEFVKIIFVIVIALLLEDNKIAMKKFLIMCFFAAFCIAVLVVQKDLGTALLFAGTFIVVYFVASGKGLVTLGFLGVGAGGAVASYYLFDHVRTRVEVWLDPWSQYNGKGYQIVQGLIAMASGGLFGVGLGLGSPQTVPVYYSDYIFAIICEEFGILMGIAIMCFYLVFIIRGALIAVNSESKFYALVAFGCTTLITLQSFIILGGVIKLIPLTGVTMPFMSYGGSSMMGSMMLMGILEAIAIQNGNRRIAKLAEVETNAG